MGDDLKIDESKFSVMLNDIIGTQVGLTDCVKSWPGPVSTNIDLNTTQFWKSTEDIVAEKVVETLAKKYGLKPIDWSDVNRPVIEKYKMRHK